MIGQIVESVSEQPIRYRLDRLVGQDIAKRTFLATELRSHTQVVLKLILFCPDLEAEEAMLATTTVPGFFETDIDLPYLESFEVETAIGAGLMLVKPYVTASAVTNTSSSLSSQTQPLQMQPLQMQSSHLPTATPYRQLAYSTFRVRPTAEKIEVQCLASSVQEGLTGAEAEDGLLDSLETWVAIIIGTVVFVGGIMVVTGSLPAALVVAAMLPILFYALTGAEKESDRIAILRLTSASEGRTFAALTTMKRPVRNRLGKVNSVPDSSKLHYSRLAIKNVKVSPTLVLSLGKNPLIAQLSFTFHNHDAPCKRLSIVGTYAEMRWLAHHLSQWGNRRNGDTL